MIVKLAYSIGQPVRLAKDDERTRGEVVGVDVRQEGVLYQVRWSDTYSITRHYVREIEAV